MDAAAIALPRVRTALGQSEWTRIRSEACRTHPSAINHRGFLRSKSGWAHGTDAFALARLFDEWMRGDEAEQREMFGVLRRSLDEVRPTGYKLFS